jgi:serine O-acetyltransferase
MDAFANASTGIDIHGRSANFRTPPILPHGLAGMFIAPGSCIGSNVCICQQVTIGNDFKDKSHVPHIGDNVMIFPGEKIFGLITIGEGAIIGANAVVFQDVPAYAKVVVDKPRIIEQQ